MYGNLSMPLSQALSQNNPQTVTAYDNRWNRLPDLIKNIKRNKAVYLRDFLGWHLKRTYFQCEGYQDKNYNKQDPFHSDSIVT
jgi:hypothetical protein